MQPAAFRIYAAYPDTALLEAMRADEEGAFAEIYQRYCYRLLTVAGGKLKSAEAAEELIQDLFTDLWSRRASLQIERLEPYLFSMVRYRVINYVKTQKLRAGYDLYCRISQPETDMGTENSLALSDLTSALLAGVRRLPEVAGGISAQSAGALHCTRNFDADKSIREGGRIPFDQVAQVFARLPARFLADCAADAHFFPAGKPADYQRLADKNATHRAAFQ